MSSPNNPQPLAPAKAEEARRDYRLLRRLLLMTLVLACAGPLSLNLTDPDLWGHVRYGQDWLAEGTLHRTATHTYTAEGHAWINHENLAELLLATGFPLLGIPGMLAAKCLLGMVILCLMAATARCHGVRLITTWVFLLLIASNLQAFFPLRPQLLSFLWCAVMLYMIDHAFAGWGNRRADWIHTRRKADTPTVNWRWLAVLPLLIVVWTNSHGGFVAGLAILLTYLGGRAIELVWRQGPVAWRSAAGLIALGVICLLATLVNPYGWGLHQWIASSLGTARPEITEWLPVRPGNPVFWPFMTLIAVTVIGFAFTEKRRDPVKLLILLLVGWQAAMHLRHIAFFTLLCGFWLPTHLQSVFGRLRNKAAQGLPVTSLSRWQRGAMVTALAVTISLQTLFVGQRLSSLPVSRFAYPVEAIEWMAEQGVHGKLVVSFNWAQYAIAALAPDIRVGFDGRFRTCYPQEIVDRHFDFLLGDRYDRNRLDSSGPIDGSRVLEAGEPDYVLVDRRYDNAVSVMQEADPSIWTLLYQDPAAQLWGRSSVVDDVASDQFIAKDERRVTDYMKTKPVQWPALPHDKKTAHYKKTVASEVANRTTEPTLEGEG